MRYPKHKVGRVRVWAAAGLITLAAAACSRSAQEDAVSQIASPKAALPLTTAAAPPGAPAPTAGDLPPAPPARVARLRDEGDRYAYADLGYNMSNAFADAPPDYAFDYEGVRPWVWQSDAGAYQVVEPLPGGDRYYYYQPGDDYPFLVRDPDYAYGFDNGELVVVYDRYGHALGPDEADRRAAMAGRILLRASALYGAARGGRHEAVAEDHWADRRQKLDSDRRTWDATQGQDPAWRAYDAAHQQDERDRWAEERMRRQAEAARTDRSLNDPQAAQRALAQAQSEQTWLQQRRSSQGPGAQPSGGQAPRLAAATAASPQDQPTGALTQSSGSAGAGEHRRMPPPQAGVGQPPAPPIGQQQAQTELRRNGQPRGETGAHQAPPALAATQTHQVAQQQAMLETQHRERLQQGGAPAAQAHQAAQQQAMLEAQHQAQQQAAAHQQQGQHEQHQAVLEAQHRAQQQQQGAAQYHASQQQAVLEAQHQAQQQTAAHQQEAQHPQQQALIEAQHRAQQQPQAAEQSHAAQQQAMIEAQHQAQQQAAAHQQQAQHPPQQALLEAEHRAQQQQQAAAQAHQVTQRQAAVVSHQAAPPPAKPGPPPKQPHAPPGQPPAKDKNQGQGGDGHP